MDNNPILVNDLEMSSDIPLYAQLVAIVRRNISDGTLKAGDLLPSEAELCKRFGVSRSTVRQAIGALETNGLVVRKQGRGTFVAEPRMHRKTETVYSFTSEMNAKGLRPSSTLIDFEITLPSEDIIKELELSNPETPVYRFSRVRNVNGEPLILETSYYPQFIYPHLTKELLRTHSFYSLLYEVGIVPFSAMDTYEAVKMSAFEANMLGCQEGDCAFRANRRTRTEAGMIYEHTQSLMRADRITLDVYLHRDGVTFSRNID